MLLCGEGRECYYAGTERKAEGLNRTLSNRLAKKKVEMLGYATSWIKPRAPLDTRIVKPI